MLARFQPPHLPPSPAAIACSALKRRFNYSRHTGGRMTLAEAVIRTVIRRAKLHPFDAIKLNRAVKLQLRRKMAQ